MPPLAVKRIFHPRMEKTGENPIFRLETTLFVRPGAEYADCNVRRPTRAVKPTAFAVFHARS
jgi:hypothetical protein